MSIEAGSNGGVFISHVSTQSLAFIHGLEIGDQLLEVRGHHVLCRLGRQVLQVCGINTRKATRDQARKMLQECGTSVSMLVQYNPNSEYTCTLAM